MLIWGSRNGRFPSAKITKLARFDFSETEIWEFIRELISDSERPRLRRRWTCILVEVCTEIVLVKRASRLFSKRRGISTTNFLRDESLMEVIHLFLIFGCNKFSSHLRSQEELNITRASSLLSIFPCLSSTKSLKWLKISDLINGSFSRI